MIVANFMDSSLYSLKAKGVFGEVGETYNPRRAYRRVFHFTPHPEDMTLQPTLAAWNVTLVHCPTADISVRGLLRAMVIAFRLLRRERVDIVRGRLPYLGSLVGGLAAKALNIPFVVSLGGDNRIGQERNGVYLYGSRRLSYGIERLVLRLATCIIVPNRFTQRYVASIIGQAAAERKCAVIPWISKPIKPSDYATSVAGIGLDPQTAVVPIIGFVNKYKYSDILFEVFDGWTPFMPDGRRVQFVFCGDGPLVERGISRFRNAPHVIFAGWQDQAVVHALIRKAEFVIIPMSGYVMLEAASAGKPIITSKVEWHSEIVADGVSGLLVDPLDPVMWRAAIGQMMSDPAHAQRMGTALRQRYIADYSAEQSAAAELKLYEALVARRGLAKSP